MGKNKKITFKVSGMSCNGCAASIGRALSRLDGIEKAEADFPEGKADVSFDEKKIEKEKIVETIENLGYKVEGEA
jgi:copper ion binding protein